MTDRNHEYETSGEVIKLIHDEYPAVRWACAKCGELSATIFYEKEAALVVECEWCEAVNLVHQGEKIGDEG